jgi:AraC family transcriptional regulator of arabinose operon
LFVIRRCGYNVVHQEGLTIDRPNGSGDYLFLLFRSKMEIVIGGELVTAAPNSFILYQKKSMQFYKDFEPPLVHDWFHIDSEELEPFCQQLGLPLDTLLKAHDPLYISRKVSEIQEEFIHNGQYSNEIMDATVRCLLMKLSEYHRRVELNHPISKHYDQFVAMRNSIYNAPAVFFTIEELAASVNMSRSHFQKLYKEMFGVSVIHDLIRNRLEYAMYLLENTTYAIGVVAAMCGYENEVHFMRQFKKSVNLTPSEYRQKQRA